MSTPNKNEVRRPTNKPTPSSSAKSRSPTRPSETSTPNGVARSRAINSTTGTPLSARSAAKRSSVITPDLSNTEDEDSKLEAASLIDEVKEQLRKAESTSEEYQKQAFVLQSRLDEALGEQSKLEESNNENVQKIEALQNGMKDHVRSQRDLEKKLESEKAASNREREEGQSREDELGAIIQRLKESLNQREHMNSPDGESRVSRTASFRGRSSAKQDNGSLGPPAEKRDSSSSQLIMQKDKIIEGLRLELAEVQIRVMEIENAGGGQLQELEKTLLETRMHNAKLMEDNESYQVLLQEKTLNGDLSRGVFHRTPSTDHQGSSDDDRRTSLAQELESAVVDTDVDHVRKLENENNTLKDQNKAMTLYINNIITRLLQNDKFESLFDATEPEGGKGNNSRDGPIADTNKSLPQPPAEKEETVAQSLLSRAGSVFGRGQRARPQSIQKSQPSYTGQESLQTTPERRALTTRPNPNENPLTAPSIPIKPIPATAARHARGSSGGSSRPRPPTESHYASSIVNNMHRGPSSSGQLSPSGLASPRQTPFFAGPPPPPLFGESTPGMLDDGPTPAASDADSSAAPSKPASEAAGPSDAASTPPRSPPRSVGGSSSMEAGRAGSSGGAIFGGSGATGGNKMRPLRLVREKVEADEAAEAERKRNNRQSFMGWFSGVGAMMGQGPQAQGGAPAQLTAEEVEAERARFGPGRTAE